LIGGGGGGDGGVVALIGGGGSITSRGHIQLISIYVMDKQRDCVE